MSGEVDAIAIGLAERLDTIADFTGRAYSEWPDIVNLPCAIVDGPINVRDTSLGGNDAEIEYEVFILLSLSAGLATAERQIRGYIGKTGEASIQAALEGDKTLAGRAASLIMRDGMRRLPEGTVGDVPVVGAVRTVAVYSLP